MSKRKLKAPDKVKVAKAESSVAKEVATGALRPWRRPRGSSSEPLSSSSKQQH